MNPLSHLLALFTLSVAMLQPAQADTLTGRVVGITDGDTLTLLDTTNSQHKIRLAGIDTPEKGQPFGQVCKQSLSDLVFNQPVDIQWDKLDRYGRVIGKVVKNGTDVNLEQIKSGCAWHYKKYQNEQSPADREKYSSAETNARAARSGLWVDPNPVPPWGWRHRSR
jgi:endonuclease YncB( thermonuclease family)